MSAYSNIIAYRHYDKSKRIANYNKSLELVDKIIIYNWIIYKVIKVSMLYIYVKKYQIYNASNKRLNSSLFDFVLNPTVIKLRISQAYYLIIGIDI